MNRHAATAAVHARAATRTAASPDPRPRQFALSTSDSLVAENWRCTELDGRITSITMQAWR
jgi:hypothetical protein